MMFPKPQNELNINEYDCSGHMCSSKKTIITAKILKNVIAFIN